MTVSNSWFFFSLIIVLDTPCKSVKEIICGGNDDTINGVLEVYGWERELWSQEENWERFVLARFLQPQRDEWGGVKERSACNSISLSVPHNNLSQMIHCVCRRKWRSGKETGYAISHKNLEKTLKRGNFIERKKIDFLHWSTKVNAGTLMTTIMWASEFSEM